MGLSRFKVHWAKHLSTEWRVLYPWAKYCLAPPAQKPSSLSREFSDHRITVLTSCLVIVAALALRTILPPHVSLAPFFVFGCAFPTLIISRRWGTMAAVFCTVGLSVTRIYMNTAAFHLDSFAWNALMRFFFFEFFVLLFDGLRRMARASSSTDEHSQTSPSA